MKSNLKEEDCVNFIVITNNLKLTCGLRNFIVDKLIVNISAINYIMDFIKKLDYVNLIDFEDKKIPPNIADIFNTKKMVCRISYVHFIAIFRALYDCKVFNFDYYNSGDARIVAENLYDSYIVKNSQGDVLSKETFLQYFKDSSCFQKNKDFKRFYKMIHGFFKNIIN
ncbi:MAG: hypothetical protein A2X12_03940 [Bacteroidetes bacterium GWE2_29_8]|nr:MAG: hypothetical protein A2X12_03940 [Bacteroidetes bacterium GWE2_29_8]OFY25393.1 MAG: hypothetical protein A2X02_01085 [Bacteroidetes bacterium GWF2_29_10]